MLAELLPHVIHKYANASQAVAGSFLCVADGSKSSGLKFFNCYIQGTCLGLVIRLSHFEVVGKLSGNSIDPLSTGRWLGAAKFVEELAASELALGFLHSDPKGPLAAW